MNQQINNNWLIPLDKVDSTNNYAMRLIQDGLAQNGMVVTAKTQTNGKGQRGNQWISNPGDDLAMSLILSDECVCDIFHLSFCIPVAVAEVLQEYLPNCQVNIKWTNDIYAKNQKLGGILIENIFRGSQLKWSVIGIGININSIFSMDVDWAMRPISIFQIINEKISIDLLIARIRNKILLLVNESINELKLKYEHLLWCKDLDYQFECLKNNVFFTAKILGVTEQFQLTLAVSNNEIQYYNFGEIRWVHV